MVERETSATTGSNQSLDIRALKGRGDGARSLRPFRAHYHFNVTEPVVPRSFTTGKYLLSLQDTFGPQAGSLCCDLAKFLH